MKLRPWMVLALLVACSTPEPSTGELGSLRMPLVPALTGADVVRITVFGPDGPLSTHDFPPPWPDTAELELEPGTERMVTLQASVGDLPVAIGRSETFVVTEGQVVDVRVVVDLVGVVNVLPLDVDLGLVVGVSARPLDPFEGQEPRTFLDREGDGFTGTLPVGRYALDFQLAAAIADWRPAVTAEVEVVSGNMVTWAEPLVAPDLPIPDPGVATVLELVVEGGALVGGLTPNPRDLTVRARDADGRIAAGYRGSVRFESPILPGLLGAAVLPGPYTFTEDDAGEHLFADGIQAPVSLVAAVLRLIARDDTGLEVQIDVPINP